MILSSEAVLEKEVITEIEQLQKCMKKVNASFLIISNEVGLGLVPDNRMGRLYRDILGRANQMLAQTADEVYLLVAGIPIRVKPNETSFNGSSDDVPGRQQPEERLQSRE